MYFITREINQNEFDRITYYDKFKTRKRTKNKNTNIGNIQKIINSDRYILDLKGEKQNEKRC